MLSVTVYSEGVIDLFFYNFMISRMYIFILILSYETIWILSHDDVKFKKKCIRFLILNNFLLKLS